MAAHTNPGGWNRGGDDPSHGGDEFSHPWKTLGPCDWALSLRDSPVFHSAGAVNPMGKLSNCRQSLSESDQPMRPMIEIGAVRMGCFAK